MRDYFLPLTPESSSGQALTLSRKGRGDIRKLVFMGRV
jgi:hypothetical protein